MNHATTYWGISLFYYPNAADNIASSEQIHQDSNILITDRRYFIVGQINQNVQTSIMSGSTFFGHIQCDENKC